MNKQKKAALTIRIDRETLKEYKKWLLDHGYKSINQHINYLIKKTINKNKEE